MWFAEKRDVCAAIADAARHHNQPPLQDSGYKIIAPLVGHLLNGGYDLALIKRVAVAATLEYDELRRYSKLFQLRMRVRVAQSVIETTEHERIKRESADAVVQADPAAARAMLGVMKRMLEGRDSTRSAYFRQVSAVAPIVPSRSDANR